MTRNNNKTVGQYDLSQYVIFLPIHLIWNNRRFIKNMQDSDDVLICILPRIIGIRWESETS